MWRVTGGAFTGAGALDERLRDTSPVTSRGHRAITAHRAGIAASDWHGRHVRRHLTTRERHADHGRSDYRPCRHLRARNWRTWRTRAGIRGAVPAEERRLARVLQVLRVTGHHGLHPVLWKPGPGLVGPGPQPSSHDGYIVPRSTGYRGAPTRVQAPICTRYRRYSRSASIPPPYSPNGSTRREPPASQHRLKSSPASARGRRVEPAASQPRHASCHHRSASCGHLAPGHSETMNRASRSGTPRPPPRRLTPADPTRAATPAHR